MCTSVSTFCGQHAPTTESSASQREKGTPRNATGRTRLWTDVGIKLWTNDSSGICGRTRRSCCPTNRAASHQHRPTTCGDQSSVRSVSKWITSARPQGTEINSSVSGTGCYRRLDDQSQCQSSVLAVAVISSPLRLPSRPASRSFGCDSHWTRSGSRRPAK